MAAEIEVKKENWIDSARVYFADIKSEMKRVTWPSREQVEATTVVVILSVFIFAVYFKVVDFAIEGTINKAYSALVK